MLKRAFLLTVIVFCCLLTQAAQAGVIYQNFEDNSTLPINIWGSAAVVDRAEAAYSGNKSLKMSSSSYWSVAGVGARPNTYLDIKQTNNDRLAFWVFAKPVRLCYIYGCAAGTDNTVGVTLYDNNIYKTSGVEVWTTQTAKFSQWSRLKILFSQLPANFNLRQVTKVEFKQYMPGNYYIDDIQAVREDKSYQTFEPQERSGSTVSEYGWKWNDADTVGFSAAGEPARGANSWKLTTTGKWSGTGIQSQEKKYITTPNGPVQSFWNVDLAPEINDRLTFWAYALPSNGMDNNISVQFYDNKNHATDATKVSIWPKKPVVTGQWTRISVLFSEVRALAPDFDFRDINKIQFQSYWPGTFYIDDIMASGFIPFMAQDPDVINWSKLGTGLNYRLQSSPSGKEGTWKTIYLGTASTFPRQNVSVNFFRVRWEEQVTGPTAIAYVSPWSDTFEYIPSSVTLSYANLRAGKIIWPATGLYTAYQIQKSTSEFGPWLAMYEGPSITTLTATSNMWYRIRGIQQSNGQIIGMSPWSRPQVYANRYVKSSGQVLKDNNGTGKTLVLNGVNLGGGLVNEQWMTAIGTADQPTLDDDWSIQNTLEARFTPTEVKSLRDIYQAAYIHNYDMDYLLKLGVTVVRLPFWYRNLQDDNGNWKLNALGQIDFSPLDRIVNGFADRGIYVILDLHGAPGLQSADANTGRKGFNKLFAGDGEVYRQRTVALWTEIAKRYKNNTWVLGYDLLNEPVGAAPNTMALADLYDRIYRAIRAVDPNHLIMMEGIWFTDTSTSKEVVDWATLPIPSVRGWINVLYQFHFYHWNDIDSNGNAVNTDENYASHKAFIDDKIAKAAAAQPLYNVPVLVGEFYGFGLKSIWDYYTQAFNAKQWSWTSWSYKYHDSPQNWGLVNHTLYNEALPKITTDSYADLYRKFAKYTTHFYHSANVALQRLMATSLFSVSNAPTNVPYLVSLSDKFIEPNQELSIMGKNFGNVGVGTAMPASHAVLLQSNVGVGTMAPAMAIAVTQWSNNTVKAGIPNSAVPGLYAITVKTNQGISNAENVLIVPHDPALDPAPSTATGYQLPDTFLDTFERCNGRPLGTHGCV